MEHNKRRDVGLSLGLVHCPVLYAYFDRPRPIHFVAK